MVVINHRVSHLPTLVCHRVIHAAPCPPAPMPAASSPMSRAAQAEEIARRARLDGRTVSGWLARLIADTLSADDQDVGAEEEGHARDHGHQPPRAAVDPEYAEWLRRNPGRR